MCSMLRPEQLLYPQRVPSEPLAASTLLLLRDRPEGGWEVLMTRRSSAASFGPGMYVFPGGCIEAQDGQIPAEVVQFRPEMEAATRTATVAALRETLEEMGVLLALRADGAPAAQAEVDALDRHAPLWPQLQQTGLRLDAAALWQVGHFTAPAHLPKRFAVPFLWHACQRGRRPCLTTASSLKLSG